MCEEACVATARRRVTEEAEKEEMAAVEARGIVAADVAFNDTGLPAPNTEREKFIEQWCKHGSWQICEKCSALRPLPLQPMDTKRVQKPSVKECRNCKCLRQKTGKPHYVPQPDHVPEELRNLKPQVIDALRPLDIDAGRYERANYGYRVHSSMMTFAWAAKSVSDKIEDLKKRHDREAADRAFEYLMECDDSMYASFVLRQDKYLASFAEVPEEKKRKRPLRFIEEKGLECALWPHIYWHKNLCETVVRATDERRTWSRRTGLSDDSGSESSEESSAESNKDEDSEKESGSEESGEDGSTPWLRKGRHSIRQSFMTKVLSPVVGYSEDYELLHFVYDLVMWSTLGATKNAARGVPLRLALKGASFTPAYWKVRHLGVIDMQRQCGYPGLFRTRAPYEKSFPYHQWVMDEMAKTGRGRQMLAGPETLHQAHVLRELDRGYFSGTNYRRAGDQSLKWTRHLLAGEAPPAIEGVEQQVQQPPRTVLNQFSRLEFQDGKRKRGTQRYHGRGTTHSHTLDYLENADSIRLESKVSATLPAETEDPLLRGLVLDGQRDWKNSGWPVREEA